MMEKKQVRRRIGLMIILVALLALALNYKGMVLRATMPDFEHIKVAEITFADDSVRLVLEFSVQNKGYWNIDLLHTQLQVFDDTILLMTYTNDSIKTLKRNEHKADFLYITLPIQKILGRIREHQGEDSTTVLVKGKVSFETMFGEGSLEVDTSFLVRVPIPPQVYVRQVDYLRQKGDAADMVMLHVTLVNYNPTEVVLKDVNYEVGGNDLIGMRGSLPSVTINALDSTLLEVPATLEIANKARLITRIVLDKDMVAYSFVLTGTLVAITGLVDHDVPLTIRAFGQYELYDAKRKHKPRINIVRRNR